MNQLVSRMELIAATAAHTPACGTDADGDLKSIAWSDDAALRQIHRLARQGIADAARGEQAVALESPAPQSSVQIEGRAKGPPAVTVKVYAGDVDEALARALSTYAKAVAGVAEAPAEEGATP